MTSIKTALTVQDLFETFSLFVLVRHAHAEKNPARKDSDRRLSPEGNTQAHALRRILHRSTFDLTVSTPSFRAIQTAMIANRTKSVTILSDLDIESDNPNSPLYKMFDALHYAPLSAYFEHSLAEDMKKYGRRALGAIVENSKPIRPRANVLLAGHAVTNNAIIWAMTEVLEGTPHSNPELRDIALTTQFGDAQGVKVEFSQGKIFCSHITNLM